MGALRRQRVHWPGSSVMPSRANCASGCSITPGKLSICVKSWCGIVGRIRGLGGGTDAVEPAGLNDR